MKPSAGIIGRQTKAHEETQEALVKEESTKAIENDRPKKDQVQLWDRNGELEEFVAWLLRSTKWSDTYIKRHIAEQKS